LNPVEVTNKSENKKKTPSPLERFFRFEDFQSGALLDVAQQNPVEVT